MKNKPEVKIYDGDACIFHYGDRITLETVEDVERLIKDLQDILEVLKKREND